MTTLAEAKSDFRLIRDLPHKKRDVDFKMLWHCSYWDGVLSGVILMGGHEHWFECVLDGVVGLSSDVEEGHLTGRNFAIVRLEDEQIGELYRRHRDFQESVGTHCDYDESGKRALGAHQKDSEGYYKRAKERPTLDFSNNEVVAWWGRIHFNEEDLLYDMISDDEADKLWVSAEETRNRANRRRESDLWWTDFFNNDPLYLAFVEGLKDPIFNPEKNHGIGWTYEGWAPELKLEESRFCKRIASKTPTQPYTIDFEWAVKTGPVKLVIYKDGVTHRSEIFSGHYVEKIRDALQYAKALLGGVS